LAQVLVFDARGGPAHLGAVSSLRAGCERPSGSGKRQSGSQCYKKMSHDNLQKKWFVARGLRTRESGWEISMLRRSTDRFLALQHMASSKPQESCAIRVPTLQFSMVYR